MSETLPTANGVSLALEVSGLDLGRLVQATTALILFGSRAAGCARDDSDWDLLAIGEGPSLATRDLDLVWIHPRELDSGVFFSTELAGHVARYGKWLHGPSEWRSSILHGPAAEHKARRLVARVRALERAWPLLNEALRREECVLVRRDFQRFGSLYRGEAVPPSRWLDDAWGALTDPECEIVRLARDASVQFDESLVKALASR